MFYVPRSMRGFTLLETIIAVAILATGIVVALTLISKSVGSVGISQNRLLATYLNQEGLDLVRNIRDNNWKDPNYPDTVNWDDGWPDCVNCELDYMVNSLSDIGDPFLKLDGNDLYNYSQGADTIFKRRITVSTISSDQKKVSSEVTWADRGKSYSEIGESYLYKWQ